MDILENGPDAPPSPARGRALLAGAVALAIGVAVVRHESAPPSEPPPVAVSTTTPAPTPTSAPTPEEPVPAPTEPVALMPCDWFLGQLALPRLDSWGAKVVSTKRVNNVQTRTYARDGGRIRIDAGCGDMAKVLSARGGGTARWVESTGDSELKPQLAVWEAKGVVGWYRVRSDGPHGPVLTGQELDRLMRAVSAGAQSV